MFPTCTAQNAPGEGVIPQGGEELEMGGFSWNGGASHTRASGGEEYPSAGPGGAASPGQREGLQSFPLPTAPKAHECLCRTHEILSPLCFTGGIFFPPAWNSVSSRFPAESAGIGWRWRGAALPRSPKVLGEIPQFIFPGCRMPFPLHSSARRYFITMFPIHMSGHFTRVRAP